jgi:hypothetical protein
MLLTHHDLCLKIVFIFAFRKRIMWDEQITESRMLHKDEFHSLYPSATTRVGLVEMDHRYAHKIPVKESVAEMCIYRTVIWKKPRRNLHRPSVFLSIGTD